MKIGIQTWGSDGDIRPFNALAGGLSAAGHEVTLVYTSVDNKDYSDLAHCMNFNIRKAYDFFDLNEDVLNKIVDCVMHERIPVKQMLVILRNFFDPAIEEMYTAAQQLCRENDIVIGHWIIHPLRVAAEKADTPYITVILNHASLPSRFLTPIGIPKLGNWLNPFWWKIVDLVVNLTLRDPVNELRIREGLPPLKSILNHGWDSHLLNLISVSPTICQRPPDWGSHHHVCGFFNMPEKAEEWQMPDDLQTFLEIGPPPVYMTFGSLAPWKEPGLTETVQLLMEAAQLAGCRAIIQANLDGLEEIPQVENLHFLSKTPHNRIFPYCAAAVHHGGAGTTQSSTLAGCPSIIVEHFVDQVFWGNELHRLGVAPPVLHRRSVTPKKLAKAISRVLDLPTMKAEAETMGRAMQKENGVQQAVELIEKQFDC